MTVDEFRQRQNELYGLPIDRDKKRSISHQESDLQIKCIKWFRLQYPWPKYLIASIPNGASTGRSNAITLKREGLWPGLPDIFIPYPKNGMHGLWIEMKNGKKGIVSDKQKETIEYLSSIGYEAKVCRTFDEFISIVKGYFN